MGEISVGELQTLRHLAIRRDGAETPFLNIANAQHLTQLGLAARSRQGWDITNAGSAYLVRLDTSGARPT